jgi:hypothetical protein
MAHRSATPKRWRNFHRHALLGDGWTSREAIMKAGLAIIILGSAMMFVANSGASAAGGQSYNNPNPDRQTYVNRSCCSWKTNKHKPIKH